MTDRICVLLDTDIGSDIDDAVALAYLLRQPRCELAGITTVSGDVAQRAACAQVICEAAGRGDVPIHCGASSVLLYGPGQPEAPQYRAIRSRPHRSDWPACTAVDFMRRTIRSRPGEVVLLSIGPLTNVALLFALDPEIPSLLRSLVSMAGVFYEPAQREWNCLVDPMATAMVYNARPPRHLSIGLDVTTKCTMPAEEVRRRFTGPLLSVVREMAEVWFTERPQIMFHDPLAAAVIFKPELCMYEDGLVSVPCDNDPGKQGHTLFATGGAAPHRVAQRVDVNGFFEEYFSVFAR